MKSPIRYSELLIIQPSTKIGTASIVILLVTCLGVIGISYFFSLKSRREIAIRRILGASNFPLVSGWLFKVILGVVIAFIIACPLQCFLPKIEWRVLHTRKDSQLDLSF
jgi:hypothetical protein